MTNHISGKSTHLINRNVLSERDIFMSLSLANASSISKINQSHINKLKQSEPWKRFIIILNSKTQLFPHYLSSVHLRVEYMGLR